MADQPDPPDKWRVYEGDPTPDPEPPEASQAPTPPPNVPYGRTTYDPVVITTSSSSVGPKLVIVMVAVAVLGVAIAGAIAIFAAVDSGVGGIGGVDAKDPEDFEELVDRLEDARGSTEVFWVGLYTDYIIVDVPYTDDPNDTREVSYNWRGGDLEDDYNKGTSTDQRFDLAEIDPDVIDGMCDPVLELAEGATPDDCYIFISKPADPDGAWFYTSASDEFNRSFSIQYDKSGNEINRTLPQ